MKTQKLSYRMLATSFFLLCLVGLLGAQVSVLPEEPVEIGTIPQFFIDDYIVDNRWALNYERGPREMVLRVFHQPKKYEGNPLWVNPNGGPAWMTIMKDPDSGLFRMWYQSNERKADARPGAAAYTTATAFAESSDGLRWTRPKLGLIDWNGSKENNAVWRGVSGRRATGAFLLDDIPEQDRRGYRHVMLYLDIDGLHLVGSQDGIHWDASSDMRIHTMHSDHANNIVYDPALKQYVMYCRAKHIYRTRRGDVLDVGASRRIARMTSKKLWAPWTSDPQNILIPDELDNQKAVNFFYGLSGYLHGGVYWGFLQPFKWNTDIDSELAFSRNGIHFQRLPTRPKLIELGPAGSWDSGLVFAAYRWVEVGEEWWLYYSGWDGPHGTRENLERGRWRVGGVGLAKVRKEGFISMRGPENGGVIATRKLRWPGGELLVNSDASHGELKVRVTDAKRKPFPGLDYEDCVAFTDDSTSHKVKWKNRSMISLKDQIIRLEFFLKNADIYTFRALGDHSRDSDASASTTPSIP